MTDDQKRQAQYVSIFLLRDREVSSPPTDKEIESAVVYASTAVVNMSSILQKSGAERVETADRKEVEARVKKVLSDTAGFIPIIEWVRPIIL